MEAIKMKSNRQRKHTALDRRALERFFCASATHFGLAADGAAVANAMAPFLPDRSAEQQAWRRRAGRAAPWRPASASRGRHPPRLPRLVQPRLRYRPACLEGPNWLNGGHHA